MRLRGQFLVPTVAILIVGIVASAWVSLTIMRGAINDATATTMQQLGDATASRVVSWFNDRQRTVREWSGQTLYADALQSGFVGESARKGAANDLARKFKQKCL